MVSSGVDSNKDVHPILVDSSGRPYVNLNSPAGVERADTTATHPEGIGVFGKQHVNNQWTELPVAVYTSTDANKGTWIIPITPFTRERLEGVKITDGINTVDTVKDEITGRTSLLTTRGHGKNTITVEYVASQAAVALITPGAGNHLDICGVYTASDSAAGQIDLDFATSGIKVWRHYISKFNTASTADLHIEGAADEVLTVTTTQGAQDAFIIVNYRELA